MQAYLNYLPNGSLFSQELGHPDNDSSQYTDFATAFEAVGLSWTAAFCADTFPNSDMTNGAAFGDPCCTWSQGGTPDFTVTPFTTDPTTATVCATASSATTSTAASTAASTTSSATTDTSTTSTATSTTSSAATDTTSRPPLLRPPRTLQRRPPLRPLQRPPPRRLLLRRRTPRPPQRLHPPRRTRTLSAVAVVVPSFAPKRVECPHAATSANQ